MAALLGAAIVAVLLPIWIARYLPLLDYPNHLAMVFIWRRLSDPEWGFAKWYETRFVFSPNWTQYFIVYGLGTLFGDEAGQKIFLSISLLALPASIALYAKRMGRDPRLALLAFPIAWNVNLAHGFLSYVAGLPVLFFSLTLLDRHAERPSLGRGAAAALLGAFGYTFHLLTFGLFLAVGGATALATPRPWTIRRALAAAAPVLPATAVGWLAFAASRGDRHWKLGGKFEGAYNTVLQNLGTIPTWFLDLFPGHADEIVALLLGLVWLALLLLGLRRKEGTAAQALPAWRLELAIAVAALLYFVLPRSLLRPFYWYAINRRLVVPLLLLVALAVRGRLEGTRRLVLAAGAIAGIVYMTDVALHFHRFNERMRDFEEVMAPVPRGKQVQTLMLTKRDPEVNIACFNQWSTWVQLRLGGFQPMNLDQGFPIIAHHTLPTPPWDQPERFSFRDHGEPWDYFLVYGRGDPFASARDRVRKVNEVREWALFEKLPPRPR